jgi:hypothetical protein
MRCVVTIDDWRQGRAVFTADDQRIDAVAGDILVVPPDSRRCDSRLGRLPGYTTERQPDGG